MTTDQYEREDEEKEREAPEPEVQPEALIAYQESARLTDKYFPNASEADREARTKEGTELARPRVEAELEVQGRLDEFPEVIRPEDLPPGEQDLPPGHLTQWRPDLGEDGNGALVLNTPEWEQLSPQEHNAILEHERVHKEASERDEPYTPYQEIEAKVAGLREWERQKELHEGQFTNEDLEKDMEVTRRSMEERQSDDPHDLIDTELGERALHDYQAFYDGLNDAQTEEYLSDLRERGRTNEEIKTWLGKDHIPGDSSDESDTEAKVKEAVDRRGGETTYEKADDEESAPDVAELRQQQEERQQLLEEKLPSADLDDETSVKEEIDEMREAGAGDEAAELEQQYEEYQQGQTELEAAEEARQEEYERLKEEIAAERRRIEEEDRARG